MSPALQPPRPNRWTPFLKRDGQHPPCDNSSSGEGGPTQVHLSTLGAELVSQGNCGALVPGGQDIIIKAQQTMMELHPDWLFIELDGQNAFNSLDRNAMFAGAKELAPHLLPWLRTCYEHATPLVWMCNGKAYDTHDGKPLLSQVGPRQGDPLGSDLFCMGTHNNLRAMRTKYPDFMIDAYIDNVYIAVPADRAVEVVQDMVKLQKAIGIDTNFGSSGVYSPTGDPTAILNLGFEHRKRGTITLGSPVSLDDTWIREQLQQVLKDHEPRIEGILQLSSPEPQFNIPQAQYILVTGWAGRVHQEHQDGDGQAPRLVLR